ncbi:MAG: ABC transporter substrate-binding protein [Candidatus Pristimantibacillus lignocellulolyticus]|uniref:ABC transporter substrate-binding protein n=1 Tax=Candidatus Pristimantibacillus lignocellulolyticus TaxID=2994561 RepID=A0A9J6ZJQ5_9BACL|nr:MAG: ABC transporter substrate-binding protein [Candidatus Pristimantibacillus lignocellulolyticus]
MTQRKWLKTGLAVVMASVMIIAGCGSKDANNKGANSSNAGDDTAPVTFTYFSFSSNKDILASDTTIGKKLQEQTNVDWKMEFAVGDISTKSGVMITGGDYPDVIVPEGEIDKLIDAEAFQPLNELIEKYAPNIKRVYGDYMDKFTDEDGNIYVLPFSANQGYISDPNISQGAFWIQRGVLKEFGYPEIKTLDQYFDLLAQYKAKYPTVDGKDTIGFITYAGVKDNFFTITNAPMHLAGYPNDGGVTIDMETHDAKVYAASDIEKPWLQKLNEINAAGLFDPETFTANKDQYLAKLTSGRVLGYFNYGWQVDDATNNLKTAGNDDLRYVALPIVYDESVTDQYIDPPAFVNNRGIGISVSAKDPVRIIKYFDNLLTEDNQKLVQWGEEGVTYSVDENGRYVMNNEQIANRNDNEFKRSYGWSYFEYNWPRYGNSSVFENGNSYSVGNQSEVAFAGYTEGDQAILNEYGIQTFAESFSAPQDRPWYPAWSINKEQGSAEQIFEQKSGDIQQKYFPKIVLSTPDKFESVWNEYVAEINKLDVAGYEAFVTNKVKERVAGNW